MLLQLDEACNKSAHAGLQQQNAFSLSLLLQEQHWEGETPPQGPQVQEDGEVDDTKCSAGETPIH